tara:strand:+ start:2970 stop:4313 length:1344 start_codon:yes stop_codon:yes gene_type:complete
MSDSDGGLPEESQNKQEIANAVTTNPRAPWKVEGRPVVQTYDDLLEFGFDVFSAEKIKKPSMNSAVVIVLDNESYTQHYPNNKHYWVGRYEEENTLSWKPYTEWLVDYRDRGGAGWEKIPDLFITRYKAIQIDTYQGITIVVPDPNIDHTRPIVQAEATTSTTTGVTVITKTTADPRAAGVVTESETVPAAVSTPTELTAEQRKWLGNADPTDPYILARMRAATGTGSTAGLTVINPTLVAAVKATTGVAPCLPNNPPVSQVAGSGKNPPTVTSAAEATARQVRADDAAPAQKTIVIDIRGAQQDARVKAYTDAKAAGKSEAEAQNISASVGNTVGADLLGNLDLNKSSTTPSTQTAPTTVTQQTSTPSSGSSGNNSSAAPPVRPANVYIYESIKPGFDRYDFNTGKKVFTPNSGPSKNSAGQVVSPQSTPRVSPSANDAQQQSGPF